MTLLHTPFTSPPGERARAFASGPLRTCVGCGRKATQRELVRLRLVDGLVRVDPGKSGGRGAWLHPVLECLDKATKRRAFGRAFREPNVRTDSRALRDLLTGNTRKD